jgi:RNA polymerase primary sigma factor
MPMPILSEKITNEELVDLIKRGVDVTANYELLYEQNKNLIRMMVKPYAESANEDLQDLMQEAYFGLVAAVEHYEPGGTAKFMTFASYWVKNSAQTYVRKSALLKVPAYESVNVRRYKRFCNEYERDKGYMPGDDDVSNILHLTVDDIDKIKSLAKGVSSLDTPLADTDSLTLGDTVAADYDIEEDAIDSLMDEQKKNELWKVVADHVTEQENAVVVDYYCHGYQMPDIARKYGLSHQRIQQIKNSAIGRLRRGKARKELNEKFEILDSSLFSGGFKSYCNHDFTSNVEYIAMRRAELQRGYATTVEYLNREYMQDSKERLKVLQDEYEKTLQKLEMNG